MNEFDIATSPGSALAPSYEHAQVRDVMRHGVISCGPEASVREVARIMASYHVHAVVVALREDIWGVISATDVLNVAGTERERLNAGELAATDFVTIPPETPLGEAADLMRANEIDHVLVATGRQPVGMVSTLDIAGTLAWGEA
jgi:CBS domain-containing protein